MYQPFATLTKCHYLIVGKSPSMHRTVNKWMRQSVCNWNASGIQRQFDKKPHWTCFRFETIRPCIASQKNCVWIPLASLWITFTKLKCRYFLYYKYDSRIGNHISIILNLARHQNIEQCNLLFPHLWTSVCLNYIVPSPGICTRSESWNCCINQHILI